MPGWHCPNKLAPLPIPAQNSTRRHPFATSLLHSVCPAVVKCLSGRNGMANDTIKSSRDTRLRNYLDLAEDEAIIVRELKKATSPDARRKMLTELRNLNEKRNELLDQIGNAT
jgi:hypothetical protein